jgi:hypothetical protein
MKKKAKNFYGFEQCFFPVADHVVKGMDNAEKQAC